MREGAAGADLYELAGMKSATSPKRMAGMRNEHLSVSRGNVSSALFLSALCGGFTITLFILVVLEHRGLNATLITSTLN